VTASAAKIRKANGQTPLYGMEIKKSDLNPSLTGIKADIKVFDNLSDPKTMAQFPTTESDDGELVTAGFDFSKLTDANTGGNIFNQVAVSRVKNQLQSL